MNDMPSTHTLDSYEDGQTHARKREWESLWNDEMLVKAMTSTRHPTPRRAGQLLLSQHDSFVHHSVNITNQQNLGTRKNSASTRLLSANSFSVSTYIGHLLALACLAEAWPTCEKLSRGSHFEPQRSPIGKCSTAMNRRRGTDR